MANLNDSLKKAFAAVKKDIINIKKGLSVHKGQMATHEKALIEQRQDIDSLNNNLSKYASWQKEINNTFKEHIQSSITAITSNTEEIASIKASHNEEVQTFKDDIKRIEALIKVLEEKIVYMNSKMAVTQQTPELPAYKEDVKAKSFMDRIVDWFVEDST